MTSTLSRIQADSHHVGDVARMSNEWTAAEEALSKLARDAAGGTRHNEVCAERTFGLEGKGWDGKAVHWRCLMGGHATAGQIFDNDSIEPAGHDIGCTEPKLVQLEVGTAAVIPYAGLAAPRTRAHLGLFGMFGRLTLTATVVGIVALVASGRSALWEASGSRTTSSLLSPLLERAFPTAERPEEPKPQLLVPRAVSFGVEDELPLGVSILGQTNGTSLVITGLPTGSTFSTGRLAGANSWRISAGDLTNSAIRLPPGFVGVIDLEVELRLADETIAERRSIRLERAPQPTAAIPATGTESVGAQIGDTLPAQPQSQSVESLDLLRVEDAKRVQQRLIEHGFLSGTADGVWGSLSRRALREFRVAQRLGSDDVWNEQTQRALFTESTIPASSPHLPEATGTIARPFPGAVRNPLDHSDALWIQRRLRDLGYYFGDADGTWGSTSRHSLRDFKIINRLQDNDTWDEETERRLSDQNQKGTTFIGLWGMDMDQCQHVQNGSAAITVSSRRAETAGGACNFRSVRRESPNRWVIQALCSADGNSWNANISLKLIGSKLVWSSERGTETYIRCSRQVVGEER